MKIKTIQWNIGGGFVRSAESSPTVASSYSVDGLDQIISFLRQENPDIVTFQEIHNGEVNQTQEITKALDLPHFVVDEHDHSHLATNNMLSLGIISRFPMLSHKFELFLNPKLEVKFGETTGITHDKGVSSVDLNLGETNLIVKTLHLVPFRKANIDPLDERLKSLRDDITSKLMSSNDNLLIQGDFNYDAESLHKFLPAIVGNGKTEIIQQAATTPKNRKYDHIIYRGLKLINFRVETNVLTDHYPLIAEFEI